MKKKLVISLLTIVAVVCLIFGISACEAPHEHSYGEWTVVTAPTCTEEGTEQRECDCGEEETRTIAALGHDLAEHAAQAPTCTEPGWSIYQTCTRCDYTTFEELAATGHNYESTVTTESTCTTDGVLTYTCTNCGDSYTETITASGHDYESAVTAEATCTTDGVLTYTCANCGDSYTETITASGHDYESTVTAEATCTTDGVRTYTCANCGDSYTEVIPATGHSYTSRVTTQPGCTTTGLRTYTCINCGDRYTQTIVATGHNYVDGVCTVCGAEYTHDHIIINNNGVEEICDLDKVYDYNQYSNVLTIAGNYELSCAKPGYAVFSCPKCNMPIAIEVTIDHTIIEHNGKAATCTEPGWNDYVTCEYCDYTTYKEIPAKGHNYSSAIETQPSCMTDGVRRYTCSICGDNYTEFISAKGHTYENGVCTACGHKYGDPEPHIHDYTSRITSQPSCTIPGVRTYTCACGDSYTETISPLGHNIVKHEGKAPYCGEPGYEAYEECTRCDYTTYKEIPPVSSHVTINNYGVEVPIDLDEIYYYSEFSNIFDVVGNVMHCNEISYGVFTCRNCNRPIVVEVIIDHDIREHSGKAPTCTEPGWETYQTCTRCDYTTYKEIPAKGHNYVDGVCTVCGKNETDESAE